MISKCEHNQKITYFCLNPICLETTCGGCECCMSKYHNHCESKLDSVPAPERRRQIEQIGNRKQAQGKGKASIYAPSDHSTPHPNAISESSPYNTPLSQIMKESQLTQLLRSFGKDDSTLKPKCRELQQTLQSYFNTVRNEVNSMIEGLQKVLINGVGFAWLLKKGQFATYRRLKGRQYGKVAGNDLRQFVDLIRQKGTLSKYANEKRQQQQRNSYFVAIQETSKVINDVQQTVLKRFSQLITKLEKSYGTVMSPKRGQNRSIGKLKALKDILQEIQQLKGQLGRKQTKKVTEVVSKPRRAIENSQVNQISIEVRQKDREIQKKTVKEIEQDQEKPSEKEKPGYSNVSKGHTRNYSGEVPEIFKKTFLRDPKTVSLQKNTQKIQSPPKDKTKLTVDRRNRSQKAKVKNFQFEKIDWNKYEITEQVSQLKDIKQINLGESPPQRKQRLAYDLKLLEKQKNQQNSSKKQKQQNTSQKLKNQTSSYMTQSLALKQSFPIKDKIDKTDNQQKSARDRETIQISKKLKSGKKKTKETQRAPKQEVKVEEGYGVCVENSFREQVKSGKKQCNIKYQNPELSRKIGGLKRADSFSSKDQIIEGEQKDNSELNHTILPRQDSNSKISDKKEQVQLRRFLVPINYPMSLSKELTQFQSPLIRTKMIKALSFSPSKMQKLTSNSQNSSPVTKQSSQYQSASLITSQKWQLALSAPEQKSIQLLLKSLQMPAEKAIPHLQSAMRLAPGNLSAAEYLSFLYLETNNPKACLHLCNDLLQKMQSPNSQSYKQCRLNFDNNKSAALNRLGRYSQSIVLLEDSLTHYQSEILFKNLADAYFSIGILEKALYNYEKAIETYEEYDEAHYNLAVCFFTQGNYKNARREVEIALEYAPEKEEYIELQQHIKDRIRV